MLYPTQRQAAGASVPREIDYRDTSPKTLTKIAPENALIAADTIEIPFHKQAGHHPFFILPLKLLDAVHGDHASANPATLTCCRDICVLVDSRCSLARLIRYKATRRRQGWEKIEEGKGEEKG